MATTENAHTTQSEGGKNSKFPQTRDEALSLYLSGNLKEPDSRFYIKQFVKGSPFRAGLIGLTSPVWLVGMAANLTGKAIRPFMPGHIPSELALQTRALTYYLMKFNGDNSTLTIETSSSGDQLRIKTFQALQKQIEIRANKIEEGKLNRVGHYISNHHNKAKMLEGFGILASQDKANKKSYKINNTSNVNIKLNENDAIIKSAIHHSLGKVKIGYLQTAHYLGKSIALLAAVSAFMPLFASLAPLLGAASVPIGAAILIAACVALFSGMNTYGKYKQVMSDSFCALIFFRDFRYKNSEGNYVKMNKSQVAATSIAVPLAIGAGAITAITTYSALHGILMGALFAAGVGSPPIAGIIAAGIGICVAGFMIHSALKVIQTKSFGIKAAMNDFIDKQVKDNPSLNKNSCKAMFIACYLPALTILVGGAVLSSFKLIGAIPNTLLGALPDQIQIALPVTLTNVISLPFLIECTNGLAKGLGGASATLITKTPLKNIKNPILLGMTTTLLLPFTLSTVAVIGGFNIAKSMLMTFTTPILRILSKMSDRIMPPSESATFSNIAQTAPAISAEFTATNVVGHTASGLNIGTAVLAAANPNRSQSKVVQYGDIDLFEDNADDESGYGSDAELPSPSPSPSRP